MVTENIYSVSHKIIHKGFHTSAGFMLRTFVMRPCMMRKCGLLTFNWTERNKSWTRELCALHPLIRYLLRPPTTTWQQNRRHEQRNKHSHNHGLFQGPNAQTKSLRFILRFILRQKLQCRKIILWHVGSEFTENVFHDLKHLSKMAG